MEMSKKQTEFWVALIVLCIIFAMAILLVDFGIKASILEESNRLRRVIEEQELGRVTEGTDEGRATNNASDNPPFPGDVLLDNAPRMETGNVSNGATEKARNSRTRSAKSRGQASPRTIQNGD